MAGRNAAGADNASERYVCHQCFTTHYRNDVLFAAGRTDFRCDVRQAAFRYCVDPKDEFLRWCEEGRTEVLLDWRTLPERRRRWKNGGIEAVQDIDGSWTVRRVCPSCHQPLADPCPVALGWQGDGMRESAALELFYAAQRYDAGRWRCEPQSDGLSLRYYYLTEVGGRRVLGIPDGLEQAKGTYGQDCRRHFLACADCAVVRLELAVRKDGSLDDTKASPALEAMLKSCGFTGIALKMPVVVWLDGLDRESPLEYFAQNGGQLEGRITYGFDRLRLTAGLENDPRQAYQALMWLVNETGAVRGGEK